MPYKDREMALANQRKRSLKWRASHPDYGMAWYRKNRTRVNRVAQLHNIKWRYTILLAFGGECNRCGFKDERALQIDHINGKGHKMDGHNLGRSRYHRQVLQALLQGKYQLLCANCNWIKRSERQEYNAELKR